MIGAGVLLVTSLVLRLAVDQMLGWRTDVAAFEVLPGDPWALALGLVVAWLLGAVGEELLYRGFLLDTLRGVLQPRFARSGADWWLALGIVSVVFGLAHGFQGRGAIVIAAMISFGYGTIIHLGGHNLWPAILTHGIYDTVAFVLVLSCPRIWRAPQERRTKSTSQRSSLDGTANLRTSNPGTATIRSARRAAIRSVTVPDALRGKSRV